MSSRSSGGTLCFLKDRHDRRDDLSLLVDRPEDAEVVREHSKGHQQLRLRRDHIDTGSDRPEPYPFKGSKTFAQAFRDAAVAAPPRATGQRQRRQRPPRAGPRFQLALRARPLRRKASGSR
jgi:hypothetical protein